MEAARRTSSRDNASDRVSLGSLGGNPLVRHGAIHVVVRGRILCATLGTDSFLKPGPVYERDREGDNGQRAESHEEPLDSPADSLNWWRQS